MLRKRERAFLSTKISCFYLQWKVAYNLWQSGGFLRRSVAQFWKGAWWNLTAVFLIKHMGHQLAGRALALHFLLMVSSKSLLERWKGLRNRREGDLRTHRQVFLHLELGIKHSIKYWHCQLLWVWLDPWLWVSLISYIPWCLYAHPVISRGHSLLHSLEKSQHELPNPGK